MLYLFARLFIMPWAAPLLRWYQARHSSRQAGPELDAFRQAWAEREQRNR